MSTTYLDTILDYHRARAAADDRDWRSRLIERARPASLETAIRARRAEGLSVIAEVKRRSPSKGWLAEGLDAAAIATSYVAGGATGVSVLTDQPHFGGSLDDLVAVCGSVSVPVLRKDFTVSANDIIDAANAGASAVLLIVAALTVKELEHLHAVARETGVDALVEVHTEAEAERALGVGATLIGVNQRDLHTFVVDPERAARVASVLPSSVVAIAESGLSSPLEATAAAGAGFDAVLVGETFVVAKDPVAAVHSFVGAIIAPRPA
jgi:indole-3-glycerol phosphate synthase